MRYGYFDDDRREYVITRPDTPVPWINYLGTDGHFGTVSNTAGGYSWHHDARLRRLTRYRYNNVPTDAGGRYLYLRDDADGQYWSPTWQPVRTSLDDYECRHGLSYTTISCARGCDQPLGVERGELSGSIAHGWSPHGAHHVRLALEPGESREVIFLLGYWENPRDAKFEAPPVISKAGVINKSGVNPVIDHWLDPRTVRDAFAELKAYWDDLLGVLHVDTP